MRFHLIRQNDERDCGAACLAMIARHHGARYSLSTLREATKTDRRGSNLYGLVDGARQIGLEGQALSGSLDELMDSLRDGSLPLPFIAHVRQERRYHFVVVYAVTSGQICIADPGRGLRKVSFDEFAELWTNRIVTFEVGAGFSRGDHRRATLARFFGLLRGERLRLAAILGLSLIIAAIGILGAFSFQVVLDHASGGVAPKAQGASPGFMATLLSEAIQGVVQLFPVSELTVVFGCLAFLYLLQAGIQFARGYLILALARRIDTSLLMSYFAHILDLPVSSLVLRRTGEYLSRFSDAAAIREAISGATVTVVLDATMVIGSGVVLYLQSGSLFYVALVSVSFYVATLLIFRRPVERASRRSMEANASLQSYLKEAIDGADTIKGCGAGDLVKARMSGRFATYINSVLRAGMVGISQHSISELVQSLGMVAILWLGFAAVQAGMLTLGALMTFYALFGYFIQPVRNLVDLQPSLQAAYVAADRLNDVLDLPAERQGGAELRSDGAASWELREVDFRYGHRELTLRGVDLRIGRGERVGVVGGSGSGKSTLARLLMGLHTPESGSVRIDGAEIETFDLAKLRDRIAYVDQSVFLFADTIRGNLTLGNASASDEDLVSVSKACGAHDFISGLPLGYESLLDEGGSNLSGGQRQRLAIARALVKRPDLLILDEATSALDAVTEQRVWQSLFGGSPGMSCLIISHRMATVRTCDRIYVLSDAGQIAEAGSHEELMALGGVYRQLYDSQYAGQGERISGQLVEPR